VKHCRDVLRAALNVAMKWNLVHCNAAALATIAVSRRKKPQVYDQAQASAFLEAINGHRLEALFWLALCIGSREGEALGLQWTALDFETGKVSFLRSLQRIKRQGQKQSHLELLPTKTPDSDRSVWLPQVVLEKILLPRTRQEQERNEAGSAWR